MRVYDFQKGRTVKVRMSDVHKIGNLVALPAENVPYASLRDYARSFGADYACVVTRKYNDVHPAASITIDWPFAEFYVGLTRERKRLEKASHDQALQASAGSQDRAQATA